MKKAKLITPFFIAFLILQFISNVNSHPEVHAQSNSDVYVGVDIAYGSVSELRQLLTELTLSLI